MCCYMCLRACVLGQCILPAGVKDTEIIFRCLLLKASWDQSPFFESHSASWVSWALGVKLLKWWLTSRREPCSVAYTLSTKVSHKMSHLALRINVDNKSCNRCPPQVQPANCGKCRMFGHLLFSACSTLGSCHVSSLCRRQHCANSFWAFGVLAHASPALCALAQRTLASAGDFQARWRSAC